LTLIFCCFIKLLRGLWAPTFSSSNYISCFQNISEGLEDVQEARTKFGHFSVGGLLHYRLNSAQRSEPQRTSLSTCTHRSLRQANCLAQRPKLSKSWTLATFHGPSSCDQSLVQTPSAPRTGCLWLPAYLASSHSTYLKCVLPATGHSRGRATGFFCIIFI